MEDNFYRKISLLVVEIIFLASKKQFFHLSDIPGCENSISVKWNHIFNEFFIPASENEFSLYWKQYSFIQSFVEVFEMRV